ncbi:diguanylate cyclase (GGDEF)-like protein/PAS domain S-box-containing protein [Marinobacterium sp. MBR-111]|jgi:diguanylate cyclase (GGDEF)-like protein/PAS domain S-box-containing protein|uniref:sensor domain-containing diguanylate cyclase n=1 Tax=Marinobacterium sp. MBR-111 TaxID=3156463 RepID=UPI003396589B
MRTISFRALLITSSLLLLLIFFGMTVYSLNERQNLFQQQLDRKADSLQQSFELMLHEQENKMMLLASMVAADPAVQELFYHGSRMVLIEGGGKGGVEAARLRQALFDRVAPAWQQMQEQYALRQLHFHLPPAKSYLRVHAPDHFGDDLSSIRPIIVNTNHTGEPQTGFEIGRVYSGIRGVTPVWYTRQDGTRVQVGALEAGASVDSVLSRLAPMLDSELTLLLNRKDVERAVWDEFKPKPVSACDCYIEATTSDRFTQWMQHSELSFDELSRQGGVEILNWEGRIYSLARFPLQDYSSQTERSALPPPGIIISWQDITELWHEEQRAQQLLILITAGAYMLTQLLLLLLLRRLREMMQQRVNAAAAEAEQAQLQLTSLLSDSPVVTYSLRIPGTSLDYISPNCTHLLGYHPEHIIGDDHWWSEHIHPHDREYVRQTLDWTQWPTKGIRRRYRLQHNNGQWRWIEDRCRASRSADGVQMLNGVLLDITAQHRAEEALKESERSLRRAQRIGAVGSWEYHFADQSLTWSEETYRIFSVTPEQTPDYALFISRVHPDDRELVDSTWHNAIQGGRYDLEHRVVAGGEVRWVREMADFEHDETGVLRATGMVQDITSQKLREQELHRLATSDALTGLANRRYFMERLEQERARAVRFNTRCGLMMIDLDHFKQVNDQFGHATGDRVLKAFADTAAAQMRQIDIIGRIGGEEFAVLLPGTDMEGAKILAERLRLAIAAISFADIYSLHVTTSIGVTVITKTDHEVDAPLGRADKAVYTAKHNGRDRIEIAE